ncbi:MAG: SseB family protein [Clostridia bacterium]|nr:SseB family protein [Clostridia bacterium]
MKKQIKLTLKRVYFSDALGYHLAVEENTGLLVMEVVDTTGDIIGIPGQTSAETPSKLLLGLTREEFDMKDTNPELLDSFAAMLMTALPKDRVIFETGVRLEPREETIDDGDYAKWQKEEFEKRRKAAIAARAAKAKKLIGEMLECGEGWYISTKGACGKIPTIDGSGAVQIFTKEEYAKNVIEKASEVDLEIRHMDKNGINTFFADLFKYGILGVKVDLLQEHSGEVARDDFAKLGDIKGYQLLNSKTHSLMIRYLQAKRLCDETKAKLSSATLWNMFCKEFPKGLYFVPMCLEGEEGNVTDSGEIYFTERAAKLMRETKPAIVGLDKYKSAAGGGRMKFVALKNSTAGEERSFFPIFTDIVELKAVFANRAKLCMIAYEDIRENYGKFFGVVVNPAGVNLTITAAGMENIEKEKDGPVKVYKQKEDDGSEESQKE